MLFWSANRVIFFLRVWDTRYRLKNYNHFSLFLRIGFHYFLNGFKYPGSFICSFVNGCPGRFRSETIVPLLSLAIPMTFQVFNFQIYIFLFYIIRITPHIKLKRITKRRLKILSSFVLSLFLHENNKYITTLFVYFDAYIYTDVS